MRRVKLEGDKEIWRRGVQREEAPVVHSFICLPQDGSKPGTGVDPGDHISFSRRDFVSDNICLRICAGCRGRS